MTRNPRKPIALALVALALLLIAPSTLGAEQTREGYVAAVEPICQANSKANEKILAGVRSEVRQGKLKPAAAQFAKASAALKHALDELRAVARPRADRPRLTNWLGYIKGEVELFAATAGELKAGHKSAAERNSAKLSRDADLANDQVLPFEFHYCRAEPSKFT